MVKILSTIEKKEKWYYDTVYEPSNSFPNEIYQYRRIFGNANIGMRNLCNLDTPGCFYGDKTFIITDFMIKSWFGMSPEIAQPRLDAVEMGTSFMFTVGNKEEVQFPLMSSRILTDYEIEKMEQNPYNEPEIQNSFDFPAYLIGGARKLNLETSFEEDCDEIENDDDLPEEEKPSNVIQSGIRTYWYKPAKQFHVPPRQNFSVNVVMEDFALEAANQPGVRMLRFWIGGIEVGNIQ